MENGIDSGGLFQHEGFEHDDRGSSLSRGHDGTQQPAVRVRETTEPRFETCPVATVSARVLSTRSTAPTATLSEASSSSPRTASRTTVYASGGAAVSQTRSFSNPEAPLQDREAAAIYDVQAELEQLKSLLFLFSIDVHIDRTNIHASYGEPEANRRNEKKIKMEMAEESIGRD